MQNFRLLLDHWPALLFSRTRKVLWHNRRSQQNQLYSWTQPSRTKAMPMHARSFLKVSLKVKINVLSFHHERALSIQPSQSVGNFENLYHQLERNFILLKSVGMECFSSLFFLITDKSSDSVKMPIYETVDSTSLYYCGKLRPLFHLYEQTRIAAEYSRFLLTHIMADSISKSLYL